MSLTESSPVTLIHPIDCRAAELWGRKRSRVRRVERKETSLKLVSLNRGK